MESIIGVNAVRVSRLTADGTPDFGNDAGAFVMCGGVTTFEHSFETEAGSSIFQRDAAGNTCVNRKRPDDVKWTTFTLTVCRRDPRFEEIILESNATLLTDLSDYPVGIGIRAGGSCGETTTRTGVLIELWSELQDCDVPASPNPYQRLVLPRAYLTPSGVSREDGVSLPVYTGFASANTNIGNGPFDDFDLTETVDDLIYFDFGDDELPTCETPLDYVALPAS
jgi:hypothetical protein